MSMVPVPALRATQLQKHANISTRISHISELEVHSRRNDSCPSASPCRVERVGPGKFHRASLLPRGPTMRRFSEVFHPLSFWSRRWLLPFAFAWACVTASSVAFLAYHHHLPPTVFEQLLNPKRLRRRLLHLTWKVPPS